MEFNSENFILCIINLLFVPLVALHYHCRRMGRKFELSGENVYSYALICTLNLLAADFCATLLEKFLTATYDVTTGGQLGAVLPIVTLFTQLGQRVFTCSVGSRIYTVVSLISSFILVLFIELMSKTVKLDVTIEKKERKNRRSKKGKENEAES